MVHPPVKKRAAAADEAGRPQRLTLPIAPKANARMRFATSTGQTMGAMSVDEAVTYVKRFMEDGGAVEVVDLAGPGEPLATPEATIDCLLRLSQSYPSLSLGLSSNGLGGARMAEALLASGLKRVTLTVDAISTVTAAKLYAWVRPGLRTVPLPQAVITLLNEQATTIAAFAKAAIPVCISTTVYPGVNDGEIEEIAMKTAALGAAGMAIIPYRPLPGDAEALEAPSAELMERVMAGAGKYLAVVEEDAGGPGSGGGGEAMPPPVLSIPMATAARPNVAVTSLSGMEIDQHLGQAARLLIYGPREDGLVCLLGTRPTPASGTGVERWQALAASVADCFALLTASAGDTPREVLSGLGIKVLITDGDIEGTVDVLYGGGKKNKKSC